MPVIGRLRIGYEGSQNGMVVEFDGDTAKFLSADGAFSAPITNIADDSVTLAKLTGDTADWQVIQRISGVLVWGQFALENRTSDPGTPAEGQMWLRTDL